MGSVCYDFLSDSILFSENNLNDNFNSVGDDALHSELAKYRDHIIANRNLLVADIVKLDSTLKVFSTINDIPETTLLQSALYIEQFIVDDPLFKLTRKGEKTGNALGDYLGYQDSAIDRATLSGVLKTLKRITPMIAGNYIKLLPVSFIFEPQPKTPIFYSPNFFEDDLPPAILNFCKKNAKINSMKQVEGGWLMMNTNDYTPGLYVGFGEDYLNNGMMYHYVNQEYFKTDDPLEFETVMTLAEYPMEQNIWEGWVKQSINRSAINVVDKVYQEIGLASRLSSTYLTDNAFTSGLINQNFDKVTSPEVVTINQV